MLFTITDILNNWKKGDDPEMVDIVKEEEPWLIEAFKKCVDEEKARAEYMFKDCLLYTSEAAHE